MVAGEDIDASRNSGRGECLCRPRHDPRHGTSEAPVAECDQSRADVIPTPAGEVDPKDPSRVVEQGHQDNVVSDWSALGVESCAGPRDQFAGGSRRYTPIMKSVASALRARTDAEVRRMSPAERVELAFRLGDEDIESLQASHGVDRRTAIRLIERRRQATRQPSGCLDRLIG